MSVTKLTIDLLQGYLARTEVPPQDLPGLIQNVHQLIGNLSAGEATGAVSPVVTQMPADNALRIAALVQEPELAEPPVPNQPMPSVALEVVAPVVALPVPVSIAVEEPTVAAGAIPHADILDQFLQWRQRKNLSSHTIAGQIGITPAYLSQVERGKRLPSSVLVQRLLELMKNTASASVPPDETKQTKTEPKKLAEKPNVATNAEQTKPVKAQQPIEEPVVTATPELAVIAAQTVTRNPNADLLEQIRQWILRENLSQRAAAVRLKTDQSYLSKIIAGKVIPSPQFVQQMQKLMDDSVSASVPPEETKRAKIEPKKSVTKPKSTTNVEKTKPVEAQSRRSRLIVIPEPSVAEALEQETSLPVTPAAIAVEQPTVATLVNSPADTPNQILLWRLQRNLSQNAVADQLGISRTHLSGIERGKTVPSSELMQRIQKLMEDSSAASVPLANAEQKKTVPDESLKKLEVADKPLVASMPESATSVDGAVGEVDKKPERKRKLKAVLKMVIPLDQAVSNDTVRCLLCGHEAKILARHIRSVHQMEASEYREKLGLPDTFPLAAPSHSEQQRRSAMNRKK